MKKFEIGMIIKMGNTFIIESINGNKMTVREVQHFGKINERTVKSRNLKIENWEIGQVAVFGNKTLEARAAE